MASAKRSVWAKSKSRRRLERTMPSGSLSRQRSRNTSSGHRRALGPRFFPSPGFPRKVRPERNLSSPAPSARDPHPTCRPAEGCPQNKGPQALFAGRRGSGFPGNRPSRKSPAGQRKSTASSRTGQILMTLISRRVSIRWPTNWDRRFLEGGN